MRILLSQRMGARMTRPRACVLNVTYYGRKANDGSVRVSAFGKPSAGERFRRVAGRGGKPLDTSCCIILSTKATPCHA
ncbi:MAG: hypothetical protein ACLRSW_12230 [Christensenellaceae bacterium]